MGQLALPLPWWRAVVLAQVRQAALKHADGARWSKYGACG